MRYFVSLGYLYQNGVLKQTKYLDYDNTYSYNRYNYRANVDFDLTRTTALKTALAAMWARVRIC